MRIRDIKKLKEQPDEKILPKRLKKELLLAIYPCLWYDGKNAEGLLATFSFAQLHYGI